MQNPHAAMSYKGSHEMTLDIDEALLKNKNVFSLDFGGSVIKLAYTSVHADKVTLHFSCHSLSNRCEAFMFLKDKIHDHIRAGGPVYVCGIGCNQHRDELMELLNVNILNISEVDCMVDGFQFLGRHFVISEIVHPMSELALDHGRRLSRGYAAAFNGWNTSGRMRQWKYNFTSDNMAEPYVKSTAAHDVTLDTTGDLATGDLAPIKSTIEVGAFSKNGPLVSGSNKAENSHVVFSTDDPDWVQYPAVVVLCGSAAGVNLIYEDGTYLPLGITPTCGKTFLALGSLLTGAKSYDELISLAERGTVGGVNDLFSELGLTGADDDSYTSFGTFDHTIFTLGRGVLKDIGDFKREDLAAAALYLIVDNLTSMVQTWSMYTGIKKVYFTGGFSSSSVYIRQELTKDLAFKSGANPFGCQTEPMIVKLGAYLGVLGALLKNGQS